VISFLIEELFSENMCLNIVTKNILFELKELDKI